VSDSGGELTEREKLELVERASRAFNEEGIDALLALTTEDYAFATAPEWPGGGEFRGHEAVRGFMCEFEEAWASIVFEYESARVVNGRAFIPSRWVGEGKASGAESSVDFFTVIAFEGPRLQRMDVFFSETDALACAQATA
jgi:ketosteroid isomerase-like protein